MTPLETNEIPDHPSPIQLFSQWFQDALDSDQIKDATAMTLATVDSENQPWTRIVLLKEHDDRGFTFFTNSNSIKGNHLEHSPKVSLCFYWPPLDRQIRIMGTARKITPQESETYFASRPRESQISAWASIQSSELDERLTLMNRYDKFTKQYENADIPRPDFWNGYRVTPHQIEFWLSRPHRLHERLNYTRQPDNTWQKSALHP
jgi:pyridoxamine 5'-phosphate oxidase